MNTRWLDDEEAAAWVRLAGILELLPGVLDSQLRRDAELTHFEYYALAMLSESPEHTLRMTSLAAQTNSTLPRLSHVVRRLEDHPLRRLYDAGVPIVLNSDDPAMFRCSLVDEYRLAQRVFGFSEPELRGLAENSFLYAFSR